jgi:SAM-dependent methyltransferase
MNAGSRLASSEVRSLLEEARGGGYAADAWSGYHKLIYSLAQQYDAPRMLEVGGGRSPTFDQSEIKALNADYTVNDIDQSELERAPEWASRLHADIADSELLRTAELRSRYDLIFSHTVFEHVANPRDAYRNICWLLAPQGIAVNFIPTLYAAPFVANRLLPEHISAKVLRAVFPNRNDDEMPKFPAYYRWCTSTDATSRKLSQVGFRAAKIVPFYGHGYYNKIPGVRNVAARLWPVFRNRGWRFISSYALIVAEGTA